MGKRAVILVVIALAGCKKAGTKQDPPPPPPVTIDAAAATGSGDMGDLLGTGSGSGSGTGKDKGCAIDSGSDCTTGSGSSSTSSGAGKGSSSGGGKGSSSSSGKGSSAGNGDGTGGTSSHPKQTEACPDGTCADGLTCVSYYGIAGTRGPKFTSCEIPCKGGAACPNGQTCRTIADGPGQVCRP
jgi:hypothetical protein